MDRACKRCGSTVPESATACSCGATVDALPDPYAPPKAEPPAPLRPANPMLSVGGIVGAVFGLLVSQYFGVMLLVPGVGLFLAAFMLAKLGSAASKPMIPAVSVQCGHGLWMLVGGLIAGMLGNVAIDLLLLGAGLTWLVLRPGIAPAAVLGLYQVVVLGININQASALEHGSPDLKALLLHMLLRVGAIALLVSGVIQMRRAPAAAPAS